MKLGLIIYGHNFDYELECIVRIFFPTAQIEKIVDNNVAKMHVKNNNFTVNLEQDLTKSGVKHKNITCVDGSIITSLAQNDNIFLLNVAVRFENFSHELKDEVLPTEKNVAATCERKLAAMLFTLLAEKTGERPSWGILTGIRPVRLCAQWREQGLSDDETFSRLTENYHVLPSKAMLTLETLRAQEKIVSLNRPDTFSLYISIPFCPTRCLYCSFVSHAIDKAAKLLPEYVRLLCEEIAFVGKIAKKKGLKLLTIYMGGGTPTTLNAEQLSEILAAVRASFDFGHLLEYTVEAGRADTITEEKLRVMREFDVNRISINPQSMNDNVLNAIGRLHTAEEVEQSFKLARKLSFAEINMDLIAGLPEETIESFQKSLDKVLSLTPDNITVHALTVKRSSNLRERDGAFEVGEHETAQMLDYAEKTLKSSGYFPYYLYRQKATVDNLENVGFSKPNHEGIYNIYSMEDTHNIFAVGAGAVTKIIENGNLKRIFNFKYPYEYVSRFEEIINRKAEE